MYHASSIPPEAIALRPSCHFWLGLRRPLIQFKIKLEMFRSSVLKTKRRILDRGIGRVNQDEPTGTQYPIHLEYSVVWSCYLEKIRECA